MNSQPDARTAAKRSERRRLEPGTAPPLAAVAAIIGLAPTLGGAVVALAPIIPAVTRDEALRAVIAGVAVLLSLHGGIRWGLAARNELRVAGSSNLLLPLLPALAAWTALLLPSLPGLAVATAASAGQGAADVFAAEGGAAPVWYGRLRLRQTLALIAILAATFVGVAFGARS